MKGTDNSHSNTKVRSRIFTLHRWLGLNFGLFFIFMFLTGSILMISDELEAVFHPKIWSNKASQTAAASFGDIYDSVANDFPESRIFVLERQPQPWLADRTFATTAWGEKIVVWTDPVTAEVVEVTKALNFRAVLRDLHDSLLVPGRIGFVMVSTTALILLSLLIAGLITYRRFWRGFFRWPDRTNTERMRQGGLHRIFAVWAVGFLLITSVTGAFFMLGGLGLKGYVPPFQTANLRPQTLPDNFDGDLLNSAQQVAIEKSGIYPVSLVIPRNPKAGIQFAGFVDGDSKLFGATSVSVDPVGLDVLGLNSPEQFRGYARLKPVMNALHFGHWADPFSRLLWLGFGLLACFLAIAGLKVAILHQPDQEQPAKSNLLRSVTRKLGIFKWAYALAIVGVLAVGFLRFGPGTHPWKTISVDGAATGLAKMQIRGPLRQGRSATFRVIVGSTSLQSLRILDGDENELLMAGPASPNTTFDFDLLGQADANRIISILQPVDAENQMDIYSLGKAFW